MQAHVAGDDSVALDTARKLAKFRDLASAKADEMGFPMAMRQNAFASGPARFYFLTQLDQLLGDQERRAKMPPRGPVPKKGDDPSARVAALIRDLDQVDERQMSSFGPASSGNSSVVQDLIDMGDPAVAPLLQVLESDHRLTRLVSYGRDVRPLECFVHPVYQTAIRALTANLKTTEFNDPRFHTLRSVDSASRRALAGAIRQFWEKNRSVALVDRWYRTLLDDAAGPERWLEAAQGIISPVVERGAPFPKPGTRPMQGEPLRIGRDPSVTVLLLRRARDIERTGNPTTTHDHNFALACQFASILAIWDERASLPLLKDLSKESRIRSDRWLQQDNPANYHQSLASYLAQFTETRLKQRDAAALDEYADWLRTTTPTMLEYVIFDALKPLLAQPDQAVLASAAEWLFNLCRSQTGYVPP